MSAARRMPGIAQGVAVTLWGRLALTSVMLLALGVGPVAAQTEVIEYYGQDALGSTRIVFNDQGVAIARADYEPFGETFTVPNMPGTSGLPAKQFTGQERDPEASQDYFGARFYTPRTGRFSQVDPVYNALVDPQKWNRYAYARNNPLMFVDPSGLDGECPPTGTWNEVCTVTAPKPPPVPYLPVVPFWRPGPINSGGWDEPGAEYDHWAPPPVLEEGTLDLSKDLGVLDGTQLLVVVSGNGGLGYLGVEGGAMLLVDPGTGKITVYGYVGAGPSVGAGAALQGEMALVSVGAPGDLEGIGLQVGGFFAPAGPGVVGSALVSFPSLTFGTPVGGAIGLGATAGIQITFTEIVGTFDVNRVPVTLGTVLGTILPLVPSVPRP